MTTKLSPEMFVGETPPDQYGSVFLENLSPEIQSLIAKGMAADEMIQELSTILQYQVNATRAKEIVKTAIDRYSEATNGKP